jgi:hypothetical protein
VHQVARLLKPPGFDRGVTAGPMEKETLKWWPDQLPALSRLSSELGVEAPEQKWGTEANRNLFCCLSLSCCLRSLLSAQTDGYYIYRD